MNDSILFKAFEKQKKEWSWFSSRRIIPTNQFTIIHFFAKLSSIGVLGKTRSYTVKPHWEFLDVNPISESVHLVAIGVCFSLKIREVWMDWSECPRESC
jgi:hypothetical protein